MLPDCVDADTGEAPAFMFYALSLRGTKPECKDRPDRAVAASSFVAKGRGRSALAGKGARGPSLGPRLRSAPARPLGLLPPPLGQFGRTGNTQAVLSVFRRWRRGHRLRSERRPQPVGRSWRTLELAAGKGQGQRQGQ